GVLVSTPTASTAYTFSAGGPVLWPDLEAILLVPNNAHALFARPMVTSPKAFIAIETDADAHDALVLCDGRREMVMPPGARLHGADRRNTNRQDDGGDGAAPARRRTRRPGASAVGRRPGGDRRPFYNSGPE